MVTAHPSEPPTKTPLRVGLLIDSFIQPQWVSKLIADIQSSSIAEIALIIKSLSINKPGRSRWIAKSARGNPPTQKGSDWLGFGNPNRAFLRKKRYLRIGSKCECAKIFDENHQKRRSRIERKHLLYAIYRKWDNWRFKTDPDAFLPMEVGALVSDCPMVDAKDFQKQEVETTLDVVLHFGSQRLFGHVPKIAKYGVWTYHAYGLAGFWEVMTENPVTGSSLLQVTEMGGNSVVIYHAYGPTDRRSVRRNQNSACWKSSTFVMRKLRAVYESGQAALNDAIAKPHTRQGKPNNFEMATLLVKWGQRYVSDLVHRFLYHDQWFLSYKIDDNLSEEAANAPVGLTNLRGVIPPPFRATDVIGICARGGLTNPPHLPQSSGLQSVGFKPLMPPKDRLWADPFPVQKDGKYYIFVEELIYKQDKGHISVIEMNGEEGWKTPVPVLEREYHLSYPFIFEWEQNYYMLPETGHNRTVELYECTSFPFKWELKKVLMTNVHAVDATLAEINGLWWMFVNISTEGVSNDEELYLFYSDNPLGAWVPHKRNPVKSDVRSSRSAGYIFERNGELYRPSQDCGVRYGYAITINKILHINPDEYLEVEASKLLPDWERNIVGTHTLNHAHGLTVIDGVRKKNRRSFSISRIFPTLNP